MSISLHLGAKLLMETYKLKSNQGTCHTGICNIPLHPYQIVSFLPGDALFHQGTKTLVYPHLLLDPVLLRF